METQMNNNMHSDLSHSSEKYNASEECVIIYPHVIRKVFLWLSLALALTGCTAYFVAASQTLMGYMASHIYIFWALFIIEFGLVVAITYNINKLTSTQSLMLFVLYSIINGITMSVIFVVYTEESIAVAFFVTAATFAVMSIWGFVTGTNLSSMGHLLGMGVIGIIIASVVNMFMYSSTLSYIISYAGIVIFTGLTAYDTQKIKLQLLYAEDNVEIYRKIALQGALSLYLDFINLFLYILRIFGQRK